MYSKKELSQLIVESCVAYNVEHVVISPGSRNAPLTIGFTNHSRIKSYSVVDERSAAFFGLGIAQQTQKAVALICTSGSALLNYYPAIAEAYYSNIPLIVISADRPKHLIDIGDGQTIRQENVFSNHIIFNANLIDGIDFEKENSKLISKAIQLAILKSGPTHINVPFDEPLYETTTELVINSVDTELITLESDVDYDFENFVSLWNKSSKKLILIGAHYPDEIVQQQLSKLVMDESVLVFTETTSNVHHPKFINCIDKLISPLTDEDFERLKPEVLLTLGGLVVSKKVKQFLRKFKPEHHWHVHNDKSLDTFHCLSHHFKMPASLFLSYFTTIVESKNSDYQKTWLLEKERRTLKHNQFLSEVEFSDLKAFDVILNNLPDNIQLQLSNSSVIRYTQLFDNNSTIKIFCNRGTSGIDGSTSTAVGAASVSEGQTVLITGDISFFYDSNGLWNKYIPSSFRIILLNNGGGGIFKILPGPPQTNALDYFETHHNLSAEHLCKMYQFDYVKAENLIELSTQIKTFFYNSNRPKLLEILTPSNLNDKILKSYFKNVN
ncbi:2-succinyl-5-enolpyruvyl-6-hydroxy-3-cyclohexene-1-carboxylic-acid synthase [Aureibaculum marinum]|uniref:2-succinyl-5-enolpyruvyl-6-hydroxy-3-cyclohexene-1-carboxylate synthase n=1 Tax=Aureibaculum marinum TaxID=2487930 RepID=A0A3N4P514_9FLAO|nr:2-succinyl-5-enolpyruvyl-6-hydroxy-3-cyclohexene-1-carboxylic-acid synthase [Aureibaculum marinum]